MALQWFIFAWFGILIVVTLLPRRQLSGRFVLLLKALFPSWRFFDHLGEKPTLMFRTGHDSQSLGPWNPCFKKLKPRWTQLAFNPHGNLQLACESLVSHLTATVESAELGPDTKLQHDVSFKLCENFVRELAKKTSKKSRAFQFKLRIGDDDVMISPPSSLEQS